VKHTYNVIDMFCGAGGESTGIMQAAEQQGLNVSLTAINHWERAIATHAANHPGAHHWCQSIEHLDPTVVIKKGKVNLLWASPECTHHSVARGGRPRSDQSRASAWLILKWLSELYVERVIIENVPEFLSWGPLDSSGRPLPSQRGKTFNAFVTSLKSLGYAVDWRILCAADYGDPTTRKRLFIQAVKGRKKIMWPQITHMDGAGNLMGYQQWIPARDIIDWSIPGQSIFDRKKPLADATMRRIAAGIEKYWGEYAKPFLAVLYGSNDVRSLDLPLPAVTGSGAHHALIEPVPLLMGHESGQMPKPVDQPVHTVMAQGRVNLITPFMLGQQSGAAARPVDQPTPTVATAGAISLVEPFVFNIGQTSAKDRARSIEEPLSTIVTKAEHCLVEPLLVEYYGNGNTKPVDQPVGTVTTKDRYGLLEPFMVKCCHGGGDDRSNENAIIHAAGLDIRFRMLKNHELKKAQGFPDNYILTGNTTEQTKQIGNAVPVKTAKALALAAMSA
jgi:DNA (cytosine-5)-methyltransferase 1